MASPFRIDSVTVSAADYEAAIGRFGTAPRSEPLTVADVERIVDAKLRESPTAGPWRNTMAGRARHYERTGMLAAFVSDNRWSVCGYGAIPVAEGKVGGAEGERMADAVLRAMGVTLRG